MRLGYSIVLGELVRAEDVAHGDAARFQIVCPCCREAVHKKVRPVPSRGKGAETHYLSHHRGADDDAAKACELRVAALHREAEAAFNAESRGQTLQAFMRVVPAEAERVVARFHPHFDVPRRVAALLARDSFPDIAGPAERGVESLLAMGDPRSAIAESIASFEDFRGESPFWQRRQASHVLDVLRTLWTPQQARARRRVIAATFVSIAARAGEWRSRDPRAPVSGYDPLPAVRVIALVAGEGKRRAAMASATRAILSEHGRAPTAEILEERFRNLTAGLTLEPIGPVLGILANIPFADIAAGRAPGAPSPTGPARWAVLRDLLDALAAAVENARRAAEGEEAAARPGPEAPASPADSRRGGGTPTGA